MSVKFNTADLIGLKLALRDLSPKRLLSGELDDFAEDVIDYAGWYPPPLATSNRTGNLGKSWEYDIHGMEVTITNYASYAGYVHGDEQIDVHAQTGWRLLADAANDKVDDLIHRLLQKAGNIWRN